MMQYNLHDGFDQHRVARILAVLLFACTDPGGWWRGWAVIATPCEHYDCPYFGDHYFCLAEECESGLKEAALM